MRNTLRLIWFIGILFALSGCSDLGSEETSRADKVALEALTGCRTLNHNNLDFVVCAYRPAVDDIRLFHSDAEGAPYLQFERLQLSLERDGVDLVFAMNGGMYHDDRRPVGYYRDTQGDQATVNLNSGPGNFHMQPNGVFWLKDGVAGVTESAAYLEANIDPDYATQSGPLLLINGALHPRINPEGVSRKRRNGVGVSQAGDRVFFVISDSAVTFYEFASVFRDRLNTPNALFLDGQVSRIYAPQIERVEAGLDLGPIVGVVEVQND